MIEKEETEPVLIRTEHHNTCSLGIVVPCHNEEDVLPETARRLVGLLAAMISNGKICSDSRIYFVDDGSRDRTWKLIETYAGQYDSISGIKLSRNHGHQGTLLAGLMNAQGDAVVSIDADLQDDLNAIEEMVDAYREGYDVVYGVRENRSTDSLFKRWSAESYYRVLEMMGVEAIFNHADCRLLSRCALKSLSQYREVNLFLRGIVPLIGLPSKTICYTRGERFSGKSKYSLKKMLALALDGLTSFSVMPLRIITFLGFFIFLGSVILGLWVLYVNFTKDTVPGWASTVLPIYFIGGIQLLCMGVIGEYIGKIYKEVKQRPRYNIEKIV